MHVFHSIKIQSEMIGIIIVFYIIIQIFFKDSLKIIMDISRYFKKRKLETKKNEDPVNGNVTDDASSSSSLVTQNIEVPITPLNLAESQNDMGETDSADCEYLTVRVFNSEFSHDYENSIFTFFSIFLTKII